MMFDPVTGEVALVIVAPDVWVIDDRELEQVLVAWSEKPIDGA